MPLLRKQTFIRKPPDPDLNPEEQVFYCEATREVFRDYDEFFQRTILCNSLVWSCAVTGKTNLTYEEALESEKNARRRLGNIPKPLKRGLLWLADHAQRGRISDLVDDVYVFASGRYFKNEVVEAIINDQWCDCRVVNVVPPSQEEIDKDAEEERADQLKEEREGSPKTKKPKKSFFPPEHLFKYQLEEVEEEEPKLHTIGAGDIRREKGTYTREKNLLFLKNIMEMGKDGNFCVKSTVAQKYKVANITFPELFSGPMPVFEITKRMKNVGAGLTSVTIKNKKEGKKKPKDGRKGKKNQGTLDGWVKGEASKASGLSKDKADSSTNHVKKQSPAEIEEEMRRIREQNERFKEEMRQRAEEAKKRRLEEKAREKERKKEEKRLLGEVLNEWKKPRDDLECDDLKQLPKPTPVRCLIPNRLFGDFLTLSEFFNGFSNTMQVTDSFPNGITFDLLEKALTQTDHAGGSFYDILSFMLTVCFDLQNEEDEEVHLDKASVAIVNANDIEKNVLGRDEDVASQIRSATQMARWPMKHQGQSLAELHLNEWSITEILRLHLAASGAFRSDKLVMWLYQQRGGYRLSDDPGLQLKMDQPQILEALNTATVYDLSIDDKTKVLNCLMYQILSFATIRDEVDEKFSELNEAKAKLRNHQMDENRRQKQLVEAGKQKRREEMMQKKEGELKAQENSNSTEDGASAVAAVDKKPPPTKKESDNTFASEAHLTERQRLKIQSVKEQDEKEKMKKEDSLRWQALETEKFLADRVSELAGKTGRSFLGRDRAYRRFWITESIPGIFVEHDDEFVGDCLPQPTPYNPNAGPMDESSALVQVKAMLDAREKSTDDKSSSDKENEEALKMQSKKGNVVAAAASTMKQKVLAAKNGSLSVGGGGGSGSGVKQEVGEEMLQPGKVEVAEDSVTRFDASSIPWGMCSADKENCIVHSTILPRTYWSFYGSIDEVDALIDNLNSRGIRESDLKDKLVNERDRLTKNLKKILNVKHLLCSNTAAAEEALGDEKKPSDDQCINSLAELTLCDQILEMEERIFCGTLGTLKVFDRLAWQEAIKRSGCDSQSNGFSWAEKSGQDTLSAAVSGELSEPPSPSQDLMDVNGSESPKTSGSCGSSSSIVSARKQQKRIHQLASAILQVAQMVDSKYLKPPLGEEEKEKKKRLKEDERKRKIDDDGVDANGDSAKENHPLLQEWATSLKNSTSIAQLFIHLTTLEASIVWSRSLLNAKCRICRRKTDDENMLLCDGCDRGHHMYCLKPKLKAVPKDDWYCNDCKPKMRIRTPKKKSRRVFEEDDDAEDEQGSDASSDASGSDDVGTDSDEAVDEDESDNNGVEESPPRRRKRPKRSVDPPKKVKQQKKNKKDLSQILGQRKCATEANERIARQVNQQQQEINSGNSSGSEEAAAAATTTTSNERQSSRLREKRKQPSRHALVDSNEISTSVSSSISRPKRRRAVDDDDVEVIFNPTVLEDVLNQMMKSKDGWPFDRPITKADAPDYHKIIDRPMDLGTIRSNLNRMKYKCNREVLDDIMLVFSNCFLYNKADVGEYQCGVRLEKHFLNEAKKLGLINQDRLPVSQDFDETQQQPAAKRGRKTL